MLKRTITYTNPFTDQEVSEEHYFHLSKADLIEMEMEEHNATYTSNGEQLTGMQAKLQKVIDSQDGRAILAEFKDIIRRAYGRKDGDRFLKSADIWEEFSSSEAFSQLLFDLCTDADIAGEFVAGIIPSNMEQIAAEVKARAEDNSSGSTPEIASAPAVVTDIATARGPEDPVVQVLSPDEVIAMDPAELKSGLAEGRYKLS